MNELNASSSGVTRMLAERAQPGIFFSLSLS